MKLLIAFLSSVLAVVAKDIKLRPLNPATPVNTELQA